jgi:hypothetical protein
VIGTKALEGAETMRRIGAVAMATGLLLGSGALAACESEEQQQIEDIQDEVGRDLDKLEDKVDEEMGGNN